MIFNKYRNKQVAVIADFKPFVLVSLFSIIIMQFIDKELFFFIFIEVIERMKNQHGILKEEKIVCID